MVTIIKKIDLPKQVYTKIPEIIQHSQKGKNVALEIDKGSVLEGSEKVIGYERDGSILFAWKCHEADGGLRTFIGVYYPPTAETKIVFTDDKGIDVASASINAEHTLLGFCLIKQKTSDETRIYSSYFVEIRPQNRIFSLSIDSQFYQKIQFLYPSGQNPFKGSRALMIHHTQTIGMYTIPLAKTGDGCSVMSGNPKTQELVNSFFWCQFDASVQRLYYARLAPHAEEGTSPSVMFLALQLTAGDKGKYIFEIVLPITVKTPSLLTQPHYHSYFVADIVGCADLNLCVKETSKGSYFVCYQETSTLLNDAGCDGNTDDDKGDLAYVIYCLHEGYSITCSVALPPDKVPTTLPIIQFVTVNDYLCVYACDVFMHLLDCSIEHCPVNNIYLFDDNLPRMPNSESLTEGGLTPHFSGGVRQSIPLARDGSMIFDSKTQVFYKLLFDKDRLLALFATTRDKSTRLAVLHCAVVHLKEPFLTRKIIECVCQDPANFECVALLKEYMIAASYSHMRALLTSFELKAFPMTTVEPLRGEFKKYSKSQSTLRLNYKRLDQELCDVLCHMLRKYDVDTWALLCRSLQLASNENFTRLPVKCLEGVSLPTNTANELSPGKAQNARVSFFQRISPGRLISSKTDSRPSETAEKDVKDLNDYSEDELSKLAVVLDQMTTHFSKCFPKEPRSKLHNMAVEYCNCRGKIIKSLWRNVLKSFGFANEAAVLGVNLSHPLQNEEMALFQLIERLQLTIAQISLAVPLGVSKTFLLLGIRCLPLHLFLQYLHAGVFVVKEDIALRALQELSDDVADNVSLKVALIQRLPKDSANQVLAQWEHPISRRYRAQQMTLKFNGDFTLSSPTYGEIAEAVFEDRDFRPVSTLLASLQHNPLAKSSSANNPTGLGREEINFVHSVALADSWKLTQGTEF